jgi:hypothetical protein
LGSRALLVLAPAVESVSPARDAALTRPRWLDWDGQVCHTLPCPTCGRVIPIKRVHLSTIRAERWHAWSVATWVEWCGHQVEVILVPDVGAWYSEIPVLGVAT